MTKEQRAEYNRQYYKKHKEHLQSSFRERNVSIPAGVYFIRLDNEIIYIGSSSRPYSRYTTHFSPCDTNYSPISIALAKGELKREELSFELYRENPNKEERYELEQQLIYKHKPKYNTIVQLKGEKRLYIHN